MAKAILALIFVFALLMAGCAGVPQEKYDALNSACTEGKAALQQNLDAQKARANSAEEKLSECTGARELQENMLRSKEAQIETLNANSDLLAEAKVKTDGIAQLDLLISYYNDAYGPGKIINNARLNRIETQVNLIGDDALPSKWQAVRDCYSIENCNSAKEAFSSYVNLKIAGLEKEAVKIIAGS